MLGADAGVGMVTGGGVAMGVGVGLDTGDLGDDRLGVGVCGGDVGPGGRDQRVEARRRVGDGARM